jgi:hypothetical protein
MNFDIRNRIRAGEAETSVILGRLVHRVMATEVGFIPAGNGDPGTAVSDPVLGSLRYAQTLPGSGTIRHISELAVRVHGDGGRRGHEEWIFQNGFRKRTGVGIDGIPRDRATVIRRINKLAARVDCQAGWRRSWLCGER